MGDAAGGADLQLAGHPRYAVIRHLNKGAYGQVVLAEDRMTGEHVALKFIERGNTITKYVEREIVNHMRLRHPQVIGLREVFLTEKHLVLAMEYAAGGDLCRYVIARQRLEEEEARWFFQQLLVAMDYCHRMGVTSRDIKLENTLLDDSPRPLIKLADFGFSKDASLHSAPTSRVGTPAYLAPEVIVNPPGATYDAQRADLWSCGVALFVMVTGYFPFERSQDVRLKPQQKLAAVLQRILSCAYSYPPGNTLSEEVKDVIRRILVADPAHRATIHELQRHPWFSDGLLQKALEYNDTVIANSVARQPALQKLAAVAQIVGEARTCLSDAAADGGGAGAFADEDASIDKILRDQDGSRGQSADNDIIEAELDRLDI